ncbi:hypothetical protein [Celeribacter sp. PS-C1]|nr:hypothetical protein [Celeribacter sp. PS-C1]
MRVLMDHPHGRRGGNRNLLPRFDRWVALALGNPLGPRQETS